MKAIYGVILLIVCLGVAVGTLESRARELELENQQLKAENLYFKQATSIAMSARGWRLPLEEITPFNLEDALNPCHTISGASIITKECKEAMIKYSPYGIAGVPIKIVLDAP